MTEYNGHPSWEHYNVHDWLFNDEGLYNETMRQCSRASTVEEAAKNLIASLEELGVTATPDKVPYTQDFVECALEGEVDE